MGHITHYCVYNILGQHIPETIRPTPEAAKSAYYKLINLTWSALNSGVKVDVIKIGEWKRQ